MRQKQPVKQWYKVKMVWLGSELVGYKLFDIVAEQFLMEVYLTRQKAEKARTAKNREKNVKQLELWN